MNSYLNGREIRKLSFDIWTDNEKKPDFLTGLFFSKIIRNILRLKSIRTNFIFLSLFGTKEFRYILSD